MKGGDDGRREKKTISLYLTFWQVRKQNTVQKSENMIIYITAWMLGKMETSKEKMLRWFSSEARTAG